MASEREEFFQQLADAIEVVKLRVKAVVLMGDFNGHVSGWASDSTNGNGKLLLRVTEATGLWILSSKVVTFLRRNGKVHL